MARQMKDSGIEWIGEIAEDHPLIKLKHVCQILDQYRSPVTADQRSQTGEVLYDYYGASGAIDKIDGYTIDDHVMLIGEDGANLRLRNLPLMYEVNGKAWINNHAHILKPNGGTDFYYLFYALEALDINPYITGSAQPKLSQENLKNIFIPMPSLAVQRKVSVVIREKSDEIDAVIERTKATIEEYKKLKQAVITEAVTKGVRGVREMKDSGIEWVEGIIDSWDMSRIGLHYNIVLGKMLCDKQLTEEHTLESYFCAANVHFDGVSQEQLKQMWFLPAEKVSYRVQDGDLLVVEGGAGAGGAAIVEKLEQPTYVQNSVMIVRGLMGQSNRYLRYWIECLVKKGYVDVVCNKATIPHFTKDKLATMPVPVIPVEEMEEIADYLDEKCAALDTLIAKKTALLTELETYKKSLIYEYVTGKKEVLL